MHPKIHAHYQDIAVKYGLQGPFLEIGASPGPKSILAGDYFRGKTGRVGINLAKTQMEKDENQIHFIQCNSNDMRSQFADGQFGTVFSNAVIEHDRYFWRSIEEMKRVLAPGGIMAVGAPGYVANLDNKLGLPKTIERATVTFDVHVKPDYWRFSRQAFKDIICEGMEILELRAIMRVPILVVVARKPV